MTREKDDKNSQQDSNSVETVTPTTSNANSGTNQFLVNGGALFLISLLGYYYYTTYLRIEAKIWSHPLEYISVPYIKELDKLNDVITYMIPAIIIFSCLLFLVSKREHFTKKDHLSEDDHDQYDYDSCNFYRRHIGITLLFLCIFVIFIIYAPKYVEILLPVYLLSMIFTVSLMFYVAIKVDRSSYKQFYRQEKIFKLLVNLYGLIFLLPITMILLFALNDYSNPTLLTTSCEKIVKDTEKAACEKYGKLYLVSENRGIGIWRAFSEQNHNEVQLSNQYFHIEMKNTHVESKTYTHVESIANTQVETKTNNND
ncbi:MULTISPECIES: hypothetical protein [unclassified Exiguobacterium]|uniref:hypothetical protein n=1 Tax=unclassified Exiguobacterium TaxID=2644629 RepID=UPI001BEAC006|nr:MULTISPECIES: hypothetical protein [unclassified Exiguobacterium]